MFVNTNVWLVKTAIPNLDDLVLPVDSQVYIFQTYEREVSILEVYNIDQSREQTIKQFGSWKLDVLKVNHLPMFERRKDMEGFIFHGETMVLSLLISLEMKRTFLVVNRRSWVGFVGMFGMRWRKS